GKVLSKIFGN
nr:Chain A, ADP-ribosylation factor 6 [synthetic construct]2BAU_A Chain A, ADP-ribosylation factor 6 [synthetic construct]